MALVSHAECLPNSRSAAAKKSTHISMKCGIINKWKHLKAKEVLTMKGSTKDRVEGKFHEAKGSVKEAVGNAFNKPNVALEGKTEKIAGKAQETLGKAKKIIGR
jgi:uncharacterized protein YjbJ (UPF0337 family)